MVYWYGGCYTDFPEFSFVKRSSIIADSTDVEKRINKFSEQVDQMQKRRQAASVNMSAIVLDTQRERALLELRADLVKPSAADRMKKFGSSKASLLVSDMKARKRKQAPMSHLSSNQVEEDLSTKRKAKDDDSLGCSPRATRQRRRAIQKPGSGEKPARKRKCREAEAIEEEPVQRKSKPLSSSLPHKISKKKSLAIVSPASQIGSSEQGRDIVTKELKLVENKNEPIPVVSQGRLIAKRRVWSAEQGRWLAYESIYAHHLRQTTTNIGPKRSISWSLRRGGQLRFFAGFINEEECEEISQEMEGQTLFRNYSFRNKQFKEPRLHVLLSPDADSKDQEDASPGVRGYNYHG
jgi:hypothetical protein